MTKDYTSDTAEHSYRVSIEMDTIYPDTMTDQGVRACDLLPIDDAKLTPGDPSPLGRDVDGDLVYPEYPDYTFLRMGRKNAAQLAHMIATDHAITEEPRPPFAPGSPELFCSQFINVALPTCFYDESNHGKLRRERDIGALLAGDFDVISPLWRYRDCDPGAA